MTKLITRASITRAVRLNWASIVAKSGVRADVVDMLPKGPLNILGSSLKTEKGESIGVLTAVVYLAPSNASGRNVCPMASLACIAGCLGENAGRMAFDQGVKRAQMWKTALRFGAPVYYFALLQLDIAAHEAKAKRLGFVSAVRLDGTSDLGDADRFVAMFPETVFYDYTKVSRRLSRVKAPNRHLTLSFSGTNEAECIDALRDGFNVAVPFDVKKGEALPTEWRGFPVIDGDATDYRPGDGFGVVVGLSWKGPKRTRDAARAAGWLQ